MKQEKTFAFIWIALGVIAGALGAHALKKVLLPEALDSFKTGVLYQLFAGTWLLLLPKPKQSPSRLFSSSRLITIGSLFFSLSIYALVLFPLMGISAKFLGPVTPIGGTFMIAGLIKAAIEQKQVD